MADITSLNEEQIKAIEHGKGPLLIIAGAGTGKTTVITERIKYLITSGKAKSQDILALTFTEKASREMEERVDQSLPYGVTQMWISTFHSFCDRVLRAEGIHIGINPNYKLMTEAETVSFLKKHLFEFSLKYFRPLGNPNKFIFGMIQHFSRLKDEDISSEEYSRWVTSLTKNEEEQDELNKYYELSGAYEKYETLKITEGVFDYADLISYTLKIFRDRPNVLKNYQRQFKYILIDEFQDTNFSQNQLAILLAGKKQNITVVGDDDQAIYRFRGAAISNMIQFREHFPKTTIVVLTKNYRSTKEILDRSYDLIQFNNPYRLEITEKIEKKLQSMRRVNGSSVRVLIADRVENEADEVVKQILDYKNQKSQTQWKDFAILVRANAHAEPFSRAMERAGVPYQFLGPGQLFRQPEVKDLIAYLKVLSTFDDTVAMYRVLSMGWLGISGRDLATLVNSIKKKGISLFEECEYVAIHNRSEFSFIEDDTKVKIEKLVAMIHKHLDLVRKETAGQILYFFLEETGILKELTQYDSSTNEQVAGNIAKFFDKLKTYEAEHGGDATVFAVVDWINLAMEMGESPLASNSDWTLNNAVNVLTIHSSKGLEFPVVFLVNLVSSRFPSIERKEQIPLPQELIKEILPEGDFHLEEERRLFYVAITRARDQLFLTAAKFYGEGKREKKLSPFISETVGEVGVNVAQNQIIGSTKQLSLLEDWAPSHLDVEKGEIEKETQRKISYISYSQLDSFTTCPLQYKYRYVVKIPVPPSAALAFGDTLHQTVHDFYIRVKAGETPLVDDLVSIYKQKWISRGYANISYENAMKKHGEELLVGFYQHAYVPRSVPQDLEQPFRIKITPMLKLGGKIDRIDKREDGKIEIIDYKTGQSTRMKDVTKDLQLSAYAMAATDQGIYSYRPEDVIVSFYFFEGQEKMSGTRTTDQLETARNEIAKKVGLMEKSSFPATPGKHCDFCEFRLICEAWQ